MKQCCGQISAGGCPEGKGWLVAPPTLCNGGWGSIYEAYVTLVLMKGERARRCFRSAVSLSNFVVSWGRARHVGCSVGPASAGGRPTNRINVCTNRLTNSLTNLGIVPTNLTNCIEGGSELGKSSYNIDSL